MPPKVREQVKLLQHSDPNIRFHAAEALGKIRHESAVPHLVKALQDEHALVRLGAVEALGRIGHKSAVPHLRNALQDAYKDVRWQVVEALVRIGHVSVVPHLAKALQDENDRIGGRAAEALGKIGLSIQGKRVEGKEAKALQMVAEYFHESEDPKIIHKAYLAALKGKVTAKNARLYVKQLRAMQGSVK